MFINKENKQITLSSSQTLFIDSLVDSNVIFNIEASHIEIIIISNNENSNSQINFNLTRDCASLLVRHLIITKENTVTKFNSYVQHLATKTICDYKLFAFAFNNSHILAFAKNKIAKGMKGSETRQMIKALTDQKGIVEAQPGLLIDEFDVIASHGNSIGQFDPKTIFYLESKGIAKKMAR